MPLHRLARSLATVLAGSALLLAGCGSPAATDVPERQPVAISMSEFRLSPQDLRLYGGGSRTFEIHNRGRLVHRFELRSEDGTRRIALGRPLKPGESQTLTVRLAPGTYEMRCAQERHNTLGERGLLRVG